MRWRGESGSSNVDDRRGISKTGGIAIGGGIAGVIYLLFQLLTGGSGGNMPDIQIPQSQSQQLTPEEKAADDERAQFVSVVLKYTEEVWEKLLPEQANQQYEKPTLVLFRGNVESACGFASSAVGPFYCPGDRQVFIDLSFYQELSQRFNAPGDFAMAYVIAHEVGHHIQKLLGTADKMNRLRQQLSEEEYNKYSVMQELQADFYAGVWAHHKKNVIEAGDIDEALNAAQAIGDDQLQKQAQGHVVPESFTHGTSQQRMFWFKKGFDTGDMRQGDTFKDPSLQ